MFPPTFYSSASSASSAVSVLGKECWRSSRLAHDLALDFFERDVAHVLALDHVDHVLGDVLGVVTDALDRLGDEQDLDGNRYGARIFHHEGDELAQYAAEFL